MKTKEARMAAFEATTGWTWENAVDETITREREALIAEKNDAQKAEFEAETGWSWEAAVDESLSRRRAELLEAGPEAVEDGDEPEDDFEAVTGWTYGDAVAVAADLQRERRIFGHVA